MNRRSLFIWFNSVAVFFGVWGIISAIAWGVTAITWIYLLDIALYLGLAYRIYRRDLAPSKRKEIE